jgi:hypothetical protein
MPEPTYVTRPLREDERDWLSEVLLERWGGNLMSVAVESASATEHSRKSKCARICERWYSIVRPVHS